MRRYALKMIKYEFSSVRKENEFESDIILEKEINNIIHILLIVDIVYN